MLRYASLLAILSEFFRTVSILSQISVPGIDTSIFELDPSPLQNIIFTTRNLDTGGLGLGPFPILAAGVHLYAATFKS